MWAEGPHTPAARDQTAAVRQFGPPAQFSSPKHYKSPQDTLLSHFHFLNYTPILQRLEDEWWAFGQPLWAFGPLFNFKSPQDTLLSNFHFLHYTPTLHRLEDQWWAFGPPLWDFGQSLHASVGQIGLGGPLGANPESLAKI